MDDDVLTGRLLVASPSLNDPNFRGTVVLVVQHGEDGAVGLVLNRQGEVPVGRVLPGWDELAAAPAVVFGGGPVATDGLVGLGLAHGQRASSWQPITDRIGLIDLDGDAALASADLDRVRVFAGHAGWAAGQLDAELSAGGWFTVDADPQDVVTGDPDGLWGRVLRRQGGVYRTVTRDPSHN